jgi:hypothetical protein
MLVKTEAAYKNRQSTSTCHNGHNTRSEDNIYHAPQFKRFDGQEWTCVDWCVMSCDGQKWTCVDWCIMSCDGQEWTCIDWCIISLLFWNTNCQPKRRRMEKPLNDFILNQFVIYLKKIRDSPTTFFFFFSIIIVIICVI